MQISFGQRPITSAKPAPKFGSAIIGWQEDKKVDGEFLREITQDMFHAPEKEVRIGVRLARGSYDDTLKRKLEEKGLNIQSQSEQRNGGTQLVGTTRLCDLAELLRMEEVLHVRKAKPV